MVIIDYEPIARAIYKTACKENIDVREVMREWIMLFENTKVFGFNRDNFMAVCIKESEGYSVDGGYVKVK